MRKYTTANLIALLGMIFFQGAPNQTLPPDSLHLTEIEKSQLIAFLKAI